MAESIEQEVARLRAEVAELRQLLDDLAVEVERKKHWEKVCQSFDPPIFKNLYRCTRCGQQWDQLTEGSPAVSGDSCPYCEMIDQGPMQYRELFVGDLP